MTKTVICSRYKKELPALEQPPLPGPMGERIAKEVSAQAWQEWQTLQTMLINEKHLSLIEPDTRKYLSEQMWQYFANEATDLPEGYQPPSQS
ncbi:MAG: oxidative damage protection protein [OM182 bacterium]|jgi:Fe-S cluster biosynthesis and repair protein YggX|nr:MAG: oxidative damage protection protein [OM182 bacterium]|tara:strand:+ start:518 stop:793 length:276 start_codon:yes stop_codon:yes gene_type:complete